MKKLKIDRVKPGMKAAAPITSKGSKIIAPEGTVLTSQFIAQLPFYKVEYIIVEDEIDASTDDTLADLIAGEEPAAKPVFVEPESAEPTNISKIRSQKQALRTSVEYQDFQLEYAENISELRRVFDEIFETGQIGETYAVLVNRATEFFTTRTSLEIFDMVHTLQGMRDPIYSHSLNVALIARAVAKWMGYSKEDLDVVTGAGLLHDIGKAKIDPAVLNKEGKLTDEEFDMIRSHSRLGYAELKPLNIDPRIKLAALQHHERADGSGYPRHLESDEIDDVAAIISVADVYDAMISSRSHRSAKCPFQVIAHFEADGFSKYHAQVIFTLLNRVAESYSSSRVLLSDGTTGQVVYINRKLLSRPIVKADDDTLIDLSLPEYKELFVKAII